MSTTRNRQPKGTPTGGQFAADQRASASVNLSHDQWQLQVDRQANRHQTTDAAMEAMEASGPRLDYLESMARLYPHLDAQEYAFDLYYPARKALSQGRIDDAEHFLNTAYELNEREQLWRDAGYEPPVNDVAGPISIGVHYHCDITASQIAGRLGLDLEDAAEAGYLPRGLAYRVGRAVGADGREQVTVRAEGLSDELALTVVDDPLEERPVFAPSAYALKIGARLSRLGNTYTRRHADHQEVSVFIDADVVPAGENAGAALEAHVREAEAMGSAAEVDAARSLATMGAEHTERTRAEIMARHGFPAVS